MCGLFFFSDSSLTKTQKNQIFSASERRGKDASGICVKREGEQYSVHKEYLPLRSLAQKLDHKSFELICGHSRLMTSGASDNQPLVTPNCIVIHNGIILNEVQLKIQIDSLIENIAQNHH